MIDYNLSNKVVLITGANHGIGAATAMEFAKQNAKVFITYFRVPSIHSEKELAEARMKGVGGNLLWEAIRQQAPDSLINEITAAGGAAVAYEYDLSYEENIKIIFDLVEKELGPVDILVNNHTHFIYDTFDPALASPERSGIHLISAENIDKFFAINARAYALMMEEFIKRFLNRKANWGRIINLSTDEADAHLGAVSYAASKHAIESYSRSAAVEAGRYGITVNIVAPGPTQTGYLTPEEEEKIAAGTPLRRVGKPEDVADVIVFLASEQACWLTGQLIYVGGGWRMHQ